MRMIALPILIASLCFSVAEALGWKSSQSNNPRVMNTTTIGRT